MLPVRYPRSDAGGSSASTSPYADSGPVGQCARHSGTRSASATCCASRLVAAGERQLEGELPKSVRTGDVPQRRTAGQRAERCGQGRPQARGQAVDFGVRCEPRDLAVDNGAQLIVVGGIIELFEDRVHEGAEGRSAGKRVPRGRRPVAAGRPSGTRSRPPRRRSRRPSAPPPARCRTARPAHAQPRSARCTTCGSTRRRVGGRRRRCSESGDRPRSAGDHAVGGPGLIVSTTSLPLLVAARARNAASASSSVGHGDGPGATAAGIVMQEQPVQWARGRVRASVPTTATSATALGSARRRSGAAHHRFPPGAAAAHAPTSLRLPVRRRRESGDRLRRERPRSPGSLGSQRSQPNGTSTTGNSRPLLVCTVMTCTAAASVSSRRLRSCPPSRLDSSRRRRSQTSNAVRPSCPSSAASCRVCAMCRRSVSSRSPPTSREHSACTCSDIETVSNSAATPRSLQDLAPDPQLQRRARLRRHRRARPAPRRPAQRSSQAPAAAPEWSGAAARAPRATAATPPPPAWRTRSSCRPARPAPRPPRGETAPVAPARWCGPGPRCRGGAGPRAHHRHAVARRCRRRAATRPGGQILADALVVPHRRPSGQPRPSRGKTRSRTGTGTLTSGLVSAPRPERPESAGHRAMPRETPRPSPRAGEHRCASSSAASGR